MVSLYQKWNYRFVQVWNMKCLFLQNALFCTKKLKLVALLKFINYPVWFMVEKHTDREEISFIFWTYFTQKKNVKKTNKQFNWCDRNVFYRLCQLHLFCINFKGCHLSHLHNKYRTNSFFLLHLIHLCVSVVRFTVIYNFK